MKRFLPLLPTLLCLALATFNSVAAESEGEIPPPKEEPRMVNPGPPPADAIVLFDGSNLDEWKNQKDGGPAPWEIKDGAMTAKTAAIVTKREFGDCQLHIEWATPEEVKGNGQGRGNNGVHFQQRYEIQVLDSYNNPTYYHGQAGAIYKQHAPLVNASRKPGEWQSYDIIFHAPRFDTDGKLLKPGTFTVLHNGILIQDHAEILGTTTHRGGPKYTAHALKQPLALYYHGNAVKFRNIWIRELWLE